MIVQTARWHRPIFALTVTGVEAGETTLEPLFVWGMKPSGKSLRGELDIRLPGGVSRLLAEDFEPEAYVEELRKLIPLKQLKRKLAEEAHRVKLVLEEFVNQHYSYVFQYCEDLDKLTQRLPQIHQTLNAWGSHVEKHRSQSSALLTDALEILKSHYELEDAKAHEELALHLCNSYCQSLSRLQPLETQSARRNSCTKTCLTLELVAGEYAAAQALQTSRLAVQQNANVSEAFAQAKDLLTSLAGRLRDQLIQMTLEQLRLSFDEVLQYAVSPSPLQGDTKQASTLKVSMRDFARLAISLAYVDPQVSKSTVRELVLVAGVDPILKKIKAESTASDEHVAFLHWTDLLHQDISTGQLSHLLTLIRGWNDEPLTTQFFTPYRLIEECVLEPLLRTVTESFPHQLIPYDLAQFRTSYVNLGRLLDSVFELLSLPQRIQFMEKSNAWKLFETKLQLHTYELLRQKAIVRELSLPVEFANKEGDGFLFAASRSLYGCIMSLFDPETFLRHELATALRCFVEMATSRYLTFVYTAVDAFIQDTSLRSILQLTYLTKDVQQFIVMLRGSEFFADPPAIESLIFTPCRQHDADVVSPPQHATSTTAYGFFHRIKPEDLPHLHGLVRQLLASIETCFRQANSNTTAMLQTQFISLISSELGAVRGIPSIYRMTNLAVTGTPSPYVKSVDECLKTLETSLEKICSLQQTSLWMIEMLNSTYIELGKRVEEVLAFTRQQELTLRQLQDQPKTDNQETLSDELKIKRQLYIDMKALKLLWGPRAQQWLQHHPEAQMSGLTTLETFVTKLRRGSPAFV